VQEAHELLTENLAVIERAIAFAARRHRLDPADAEEFAAVVKLKLVENDYAILRAFEGRSSFATFIGVVVQRMALDFRIHAWGKWHSSVEAKSLGPQAVELEKLLHRDDRSLDDAAPIMAARHGLTRHALEALAAKLPRRFPRHRDVDLEEAHSVAVTPSAEVEEPLLAIDRRAASDRVSTVMAGLMERLPDQDRLILQLRFEGGMSVADIARALLLDQKMTYRRIERNMRELRRELERTGIASGDVADLIGRDEVLLRFELGNPNRRPSIPTDAMAETETEESP
jgi:RNA polymerase sigma factor for flagellar operon FliA